MTVKLKMYLAKTINNCDENNIESVVCDLFQRFENYREIIVDMYINKAERITHTHEKQKKRYYYESELNRTGSKRKKSQAELIQRLKLNS